MFLSVYLFSPILWCKYYVILSSVLRMCRTFDFVLFRLIPPCFLCNVVAKPYKLYLGGYNTQTKVFYLPPVEPGVISTPLMASMRKALKHKDFQGFN